MVQNPRKAPGAGSLRPLNLRPLNLPVAIPVEEDLHHRPLALALDQKGRRFKVASIDDLWQIHEEWWRERPVSRLYYRVTLEHGGTAVLFRDLVDGAWYRQRGA